MIDSPDLFKKLTLFPEPELREQIVMQGRIISAGQGDIIIREGQFLDFMPIVLDGLIRVYQEKEDREILLYYVGPQETCMMSLTSAYFDKESTANGMAMENSEILVLPARFISEWQLKFKSWNEFMIRTFSNRYNELLGSFTDVAFKSVQVRLMDYLHERSERDNTERIRISHQTLANELGTTRVVVSRILKQLEYENEVRLYRGAIQLITK